MKAERVRIWRPAGEERVLLMAGHTTRYAVDPRDEYVFGIVSEGSMSSRRGSARWVVRPGQLVAWDPSGAHVGTAVDEQPWSSRLIVLGASDLAAIAADDESELPADINFPEPVISDSGLAARFVHMHRALEDSSTRLERDELLAESLQEVVERARGARPSRSLRSSDARALRIAHDYIGDLADQSISLDELAAVAGIGKFRLARLFRERIGVPPHALQVAYRVRRARLLLEAGESVAATAAATGFADQSHLHRHFKRSLGMTPGEYRRRLSR